MKKKKLPKKYLDQRDLYKIEYHTYPSGNKIELWKKNKRYGYHNFICYLENTEEEYVKNKIIEHLKNSKK